MASACLLGFLLGVRHAVEPDHLAAVSMLAVENPRPRFLGWLGASWGLGHSLALFGFGGSLLLMRCQLPAWLAALFELAICAMLVVLGARGVVRLVLARPSSGPPRRLSGRRPLMVGALHGLAGSGALSAFALASMPGLASGLAYMSLFGLGSVAGMALLTGLLGAPLRLAAASRMATAMLVSSASLLSIALGLAMAWPLLTEVH